MSDIELSSGMELQNEIAPPMANGEVIFEAPWQSRVFGLARVLCEAGHFNWDEFRERLIARIKAWEASQTGVDYQYFDCFLQALTDVLADTGLCSSLELEGRFEQFSARPHGHDH
ncbi:MAG: nitrile hydratase accessory protein [Candidatus Azotimanducaceae bacterium]|jgi:nitrile hydratase accessory protein